MNTSIYYFRVFVTFIFILIADMAFSQTPEKKLYTESDGYKWICVRDKESDTWGIQNNEGKYLFYAEGGNYQYTYLYTNFKGTFKYSFFCIGRINKRIVPKTRKERENYKYELGRCEAVIDLEGNIIIPFERGYEGISYMESDGKCYFIVNKGYEKNGICDIHGNEIVEPKYESVYYSVDGFYANLRYSDPEYKTYNGRKVFGILLNENNEVDNHCISKMLYKDRDTNFSCYELFQNGVFGITDLSGKEIIPLSDGYTMIQYRNRNGEDGYFYCQKGDTVAIYSIKGEEIIPFSLGCTYASYKDEYRVFKVSKMNGQDNIDGIYGFAGQEIIPLSCGFNLVIYDYENKGYIYCWGKKGCGAYTLDGKVIVGPVYNILEYTKEGFKGRKEGENDKLLGIFLPSHDKIYPKPKPAVQRESVVAQSSKSSATQDYGTDSKHGKILKRTSEKDNAGTVTTTEWYEDGYVSTVVIKKCTSCAGTGKSFNGFCLNCTGGFIVSRITTNPKTGDSNTYTSGSTGGNNVGIGTYSGSSNRSNNGSGSSIYTKCTSCNGSGRCSSCNGRGYKFNSYSGHDDSCPSCRGKGSCPICYGRGKL